MLPLAAVLRIRYRRVRLAAEQSGSTEGMEAGGVQGVRVGREEGAGAHGDGEKCSEIRMIFGR